MTNQLNQVLLRQEIQVGANLDAWLANGGGAGLQNALEAPEAIVKTIEAADLRGMGGAGFPTFRKWQFVMAEQAEDKYLICNGNEDEPGTFKDRLLLEKTPHQIIEGALITALATGVNHLILYINPHQNKAVEAARQAVAQWHVHPLFTAVAEALGRPLTLRVFLSSGLYIGGEETAAISSIEGGFPFPKQKPPYPAQHGIHGQPTLINNVETLAHVTHIVNHGPEWYHDLGVGQAHGTKIYSLSGDVLRPGVYELPMGTSLRDLVFEYGGGMLAGKEFKAVFTGGPSNTLLTKEDLDVALDWDSVRARRSRLGTGAMIVISVGTGIVKRVTEYIDFFADSSCGQCPPCKIGTRQISKVLRKIDTGRGRRAELDHLYNLGKLLPGSGRCALVDGAVTVLNSSLDKFMAEYEAHLIDR
ncbi:MAG: SLBB domain-containing protein [Anaerolineae bacterium]|nr:SLBB domain-containing protein [Anaerolineae bacterium]MCB0179933.1 SLBB domain-containing protein [Anaerolineae bacterium]MCB0222949.1 SLBB domain-containing protein [Anaerolineae bacterium]MCB9109492.1 SLBB domain-containing protein [Anaerolineales bacterium]